MFNQLDMLMIIVTGVLICYSAVLIALKMIKPELPKFHLSK